MLNGYNSEGLLESITNRDKSGVKIIYQDGIPRSIHECNTHPEDSVQMIPRFLNGFPVRTSQSLVVS